MIFAEATTDFPVAGIGWLVVGIAACCAAINQVDDFFQRRKDKPGEPSNEILGNRVAAVEEGLATHKLEDAKIHSEIFTKLGGVERGAQSKLEAAFDRLSLTIKDSNTDANESRKDLQKTMNEVLVALGELRGKIENK